MQLQKVDGVPFALKCPKCPHQRLLPWKEKIEEIIYGAKWYFGVAGYDENAEVDEYFIEEEDTDRVIDLLVKVIEGRPKVTTQS